MRHSKGRSSHDASTSHAPPPEPASPGELSRYCGFRMGRVGQLPLQSHQVTHSGRVPL